MLGIYRDLKQILIFNSYKGFFKASIDRGHKLPFLKNAQITIFTVACDLIFLGANTYIMFQEWHTLTENDFEIMNLRIKVEICRCLLIATFAGIQPDGKTIYKHTSKDYIQIW